MTVRTRLMLTIGGIILLLVVPAIYSITRLTELEDLAVDLEIYHTQDALALGNLRASIEGLNKALVGYLAAPDEPAFRETVHQELSIARSQARLLSGSQDLEDVADPVLAVLDTIEAATIRVEERIAAGDVAGASAIFLEYRPMLDSARAALPPVANALDERGRAAVRRAQDVSASSVRTAWLAVLIALVLTLAIGFWTTRAVSHPLGQLSVATARVADGDFEAPADLPYDRTDEIGHLSRSFGSMAEKLAELDRLKAEFVSLASHELKTPINVIGGYAELLDDGLYGELTERQREVLALIQDQAKALTRLVNQLLDLSRFEAGGLQVEPTEISLSKLLDEVEKSFRVLATQKQVDFEVEVGDSLPETAIMDHDRVRHEVLGNLLSNAFKFTSTGGAIRLEATSRNGGIHFRVKDTGVGIPPDQLDHIFEKYYQVGADAKAKGSGLGLAIAKHVVDAHGGRIHVSSEVGEGTTFDIDLPRKPG